MSSRNIVVIGAGIGGLAAAYWLRQRGYDVDILEATERPGGRMVTLERKGDRVDVGAQFYYSNCARAVEMLERVGLTAARRPIRGAVQYRLRDGSTYLYKPGSPYMKPLGLRGNLQLYGFILRYVVLGRRFPDWRITRDIPAYDNTRILDLYPSAADRAIRDYLVTPICIGKMGASPEWVSLYHYIRMLRPSLFAEYFGLANGVSSLAETMAKDLPITYGSPVRQVVVERDRVVGVQLDGDGSVRKADHVIVAVTPPAAARILPEALGEQRRFMKAIPYTALPMPIFFLDRALRRDVWCYFNDPGQDRTFLFAIDHLAKMPDMCPGGKSILTGWAAYPTTLELMTLTDEQVLQKAREDIEAMIPGVSQWIEDVQVFRHPFVNAIYPPGWYRRVLDFQAGAGRLQGVSFVSSALEGTAMEAAMASAAAAVQRICTA